MADAWLGLHALDRRQDEAIAAMAQHEARFQGERSRTGIALESRFQIGVYVTYRLNTHTDLWCAVAAWYLAAQKFERAEAAIERVAGDSHAAVFVRGRLAYLRDARSDAIDLFRQVFGQDTFLEAEARLTSAGALIAAGALAPAKDHLRWVLNQEVLPKAHAEAHYLVGRIALEGGDDKTALREFSLAYAQNPRLPGVVDDLERVQKPQASRGAGAAKPREKPASRDTPAGPPEKRPRDDVETAETVDQVIAELNRQVGQDGVKQQVRRVLAQTRAQVARKRAGLPQGRLTQHFVFTGPPGTGKTTIARAIARLYRALDVLDSGHVVEVARADLVGEYHGHTVRRTSDVLDRARDGVLFIDEAYTLQTQGFAQGDPFGQEAIDTILKRMEDDRDRLVVIVAGYPNRMREFLASNPGLNSRFTSTIEFASYTPAELVKIAQQMARSHGDTLTPDARKVLTQAMNAYEANGKLGEETFGNGRYIRNLVEKAAQERDLRLFSDPTAAPNVQAMREITSGDVQSAGRELAREL
jgi:type VII secretion ATPase EccA